MFAIYKREMRSYFTTPIGYVFIAVFLAASGFSFALTTLQVQSSDVSLYFQILMFAYIVILPLLTMKTFAEERRTRTEQLLLTAPVSLPGMVLAKFFAAFTMFLGTLLTSALYFYPMSLYGDVNWARAWGSLIAMILIGMTFISIGIFVSSLTENQFTASFGTIGILLILMVIGACAGSTGGGLKCARLLLIVKGIGRNLAQMLHPQKVQVIRVNNKPVSEKILANTNAYLCVYALILGVSFLLISLDGFSVLTNFSAVLACFNNIGPGLDAVGPACNFSEFGILSKLVLIVDMLAGRLEIFPILALFSFSAWKRMG